MATSKDETQDVTWRYSCDHNALRARRRDRAQSGHVRPGWLVKTVLLMTKNAQEALKCSEEEKRRLLKRRLMELVELMKEKDKTEATAEEQQGRQSGSLAWRAARSEVGGGGVEEQDEVIWRLKDSEKESGIFHLEYDIVGDRYVRKSAADEETKGWKAGAKESKDVFRKVEKDWKQCYLSRRGTTIFYSFAVLHKLINP